MTRIATLAASEHLMGVMTRTQMQVHDLQTQVTTGKRAQTYTGIADDAGGCWTWRSSSRCSTASSRTTR